MQLVINQYGSYLRKKEGCFLVKNEEAVFEVSARKVRTIMITTGAYVSTDALHLAMENNIDVVLLDRFGNPYSRVWHSKLGSTALIRRRQLEAGMGPEGLALVKNWVDEKLENQAAFLARLGKTRRKIPELLLRAEEDITEIRQRLAALDGTVDDRRNAIMALEGAAGRAYFAALSSVMPERFRFDGRSRNPAQDEFNAMLNYGYGVLYSLVEKACIIAGLDPYVGFLHTDDYNKKSLVFDLIEKWRIFAEEPAVYLFTGRKAKAGHFESIRGGLTLNKEGKALLIGALNGHLDEAIRHGGRNVQRRNVLQLECHRIANGLIENVDMGRL